MKPYLIQITLPDGTQGQHVGIYTDGFDAVIAAMTTFPDAQRISARRIS